MGYVLTLPVQRTELINVMLSRAGIEAMSERERKRAVKRICQTASMVLVLIPDYLAERKIRM
jgi:hypothetical protein